MPPIIHRSFSHASLTVIFLLLSISLLFAQSGGVVTGQIKDRNASAISSATVTLTNNATQAQQTAETDSEGRYEFRSLPAGLYRLRVEKSGFSNVVRNIDLNGGERAELNLELAPGEISETLTVTAARGERDALEVTARTETVTQETILRQNATGTQDSMTNVANITPVGNGPFQQRPRLRGLDSTRILVLVDGERLNTSRVATDRAGPEIGLVDPTSIASVEIVSGSGSVLYGTDALSGTINIITDQLPRLDSGVRVGGSLNLFYSSNEDGRRGTARWNLSSSKVAVSFSGELDRFANYNAGSAFGESSNYLHQNGTLRQTLLSRIFPDPFNAPFTRTSTEIPNSQAHGNSINGVGRLFFTDNDTLRINWNRRRTRNIGFPDFAPPYFFQVVSLPYSNLDKYSVRYEKRALTSWFASLAVKAYHQVQDRLLRNDFPVFSSSPPRPTDPPFDSITRLDILSDTRQNVKSYGYDVQANFLLSRRNILTVGTSFFRDHSRDSRFTRTSGRIIGFAARPPAPPRLIPQNIVLFQNSLSFPQRVPKSNFDNYGVFAQEEYDVNRRVRITGGLRVDRFNVKTLPTPGYSPLLQGVDQANPPIDPSKLPNVNGTTINRSAVSGDIGVVIRATDTLSFSGRVGRSYRHPNLEELFFTGPATVGSIIANTQVEPETGLNIDVSARVRTSRYASTFSYFNNRYRNFISTEIVTASPTAPPPGLISQAVNFARQRIQGFEFNTEYAQPAGRTVFTPFINIGYLRGSILEAINPFTRAVLRNVPADNITPLKAVAGFRWQTNNGRWWSEYNVRAQAQVDRVSPLLRDSPFLIAQDLFALPGFAVHTLRGGYNFEREHGRVALTAGLENAGNKFYREHFQFAPARGRSFTVGLLFRYF